jgi:periplasmic protein TonB
MSAAVNDRPHEIVPLPHLPLTGELHPLRREFARWLATGNVITITLAIVVCATIYFWPRPVPVDVRLIKEIPNPHDVMPPPIDPNGGGAPGVYNWVPDVGKVNYEPTDEKDLPTEVTVEQPRGGDGIENPSTEGPISNPYEGGPLIDIPAPPQATDNTGFIPFDTAPVLLSIEPPVYPPIVREAGIDGTVLVRVFIALNGHVKDAQVVDGPAALREAAVASARTGFFKPALQGTHPVEVWVVIPIRFELHERY